MTKHSGNNHAHANHEHKADHKNHNGEAAAEQVNAEVVTEDRTAELEAKIKELEAALLASNDKYIRNVAEFDNYRKRVSKDIAAARNNAVSDSLFPFLQVYDHFKMAVMAAEKSTDMNMIIQGLKMIQTNFSRAMEELGVQELNTVGQKFDHNMHDAVGMEASETVPEGTIISQMTCGYKMGDRLLRPARVVVSSGKTAPKTEESK